jgi:hypothetical protein
MSLRIDYSSLALANKRLNWDELHDNCDELHDNCDELNGNCDELNDNCDELNDNWRSTFNNRFG